MYQFLSFMHQSISPDYVYTYKTCVYTSYMCVYVFKNTRVQKTYVLCITSVCFFIPFNRNIPVRIQHIKSTFMAVQRFNQNTKNKRNIYIHDQMKNQQERQSEQSFKRDLQFGEIKLKRVMKIKFQIKPINYIFQINNGF